MVASQIEKMVGDKRRRRNRREPSGVDGGGVAIWQEKKEAEEEADKVNRLENTRRSPKLGMIRSKGMAVIHLQSQNSRGV